MRLEVYHVPSFQYRQAVFNSIHCLAHPDIRAKQRLLSSCVVSQRMASDVAIWCRDCQACCRVKVTWQLVTPVTSIPVLLSHFSQIYMDVAVPLPRSSNNYADLFTITDRSTRWLEAVRLHNIDTASCVDTLLHHWIPQFGVPAVITSNWGRQFASSVWSAVCRQLGISHIMSTAYHPQSNGMVTAHRQL